MYELDIICENLLKKHNLQAYINQTHTDIVSLIKDYFGFEIRYEYMDPNIYGFTKFDCENTKKDGKIKGSIHINANINNLDIINFTQAHECGHILIRHMFLNNTYPIAYKTDSNFDCDIESTSNYIASSLLMPKTKFIYEFVKLFKFNKLILCEKNYKEIYASENIYKLKSIFQCSKSAVINRIKNLNLIEIRNENSYNLQKGFLYNGI